MAHVKGLGILVFCLLFLPAFDSVALDGAEVATALEADGRDQPLDFRPSANVQA